jgi:ketosteroid isomerase-like protein
MYPGCNGFARQACLRYFLVAVAWLLVSACGGGNDDEDRLDDLVVAEASLTPEFDTDTLDYTAEVANSVDSTTVTPTAADSAATIEVDGTGVASGTESPPIGLEVGDNTISIVVTAEDGDDQTTYTVVVTRRPPPGDNADLARLELTAVDLDQLFDSDVTSYTASLGHFGASTRVVAEPEDEGASVELNGEPLAPGESSEYVALSPGSNTVEVVVTAEDGSAQRTYQVEITRADRVALQQEAYLKASNTGPDFFGAAVSMSGQTLVIGAPEEGSAASGVDGNENDNSLADPGAAYVFERNGSTWMQTAYLKASNPGNPDRFGGAVASDGNLVVVGAEGEQSLATGVDGDEDDNSSSLVGAAYLFERDDMGVWAQRAYLKASNAGPGDEFGRSVDLDGERVIVGAWSENSDATGVDGDGGNDNLPGSGAAYVFTRDSAGDWVQEAYLKASNTDGLDEFGRAVAISGATAAVGARFEDSRATGIGGDDSDDSLASAGAVYVFDADDDGDWAQTAYVKASNTDAGDRFGQSLALDGDLLAVGAPEEDSDASGVNGDQQDDSLERAGAVYVFERDADGGWSQTAYLKPSNPGFGDSFGSALTLSGNVLAVAAPGENSAAVGLDGDGLDNSAADSGAVYVFERDADGNWSQVSYVKASNTDSDDTFGSGVTFHGDTLVVGAELEDSADTGINGNESDDSLPDAGAGYVIR